MRIHVKPLLLLFVSIASLPIAQGQESFRRDTLKASLKIADREQQLRADGYVLDPISIQRVMSPLGEGDAIKYIQTLPGVTMGGEGGSAIYVRGGNMGSNLMTIDGVPLYGISHLLGLTTVFPGNVIGETSFHAGGFDSDEGNFTASHIRLHSKTGDFNQASGQFSLTPFLASASADVPLVHDKLSFLSSIRLSPIGLEYKVLRNVVNRYQNVLKDFETTVGDVFGKITWRPNTRNEVSLFMFGSLDRYGFILNDDTADGLTQETPESADEQNTTESSEPVTTLTQDDITRVIVQKIKQNRSNNEKIGQLLKAHGVSKVSELPAAKYEAFLTDLSAI